MLSHVLISLLVLNSALCQINGEFWWLHEKVAQLQHVEPPQPKFEDINESETDESVKVVFKDNEIFSSEKTNEMENKTIILVKNELLPIVVYMDDHTDLVKQEAIKTNTLKKNSNMITFQDKTNVSLLNGLDQKTTPTSTNKSNRDEFEFVFPKNNDDLWEDKMKTNIHYNTSKILNLTNANNIINKHNQIINDKIWFEEETKQTETESICTFLMAHECISKNGFIHMPRLCSKNAQSIKRKICCILPLTSIPQNFNSIYKRYKRSDPGKILSAALKQRNALLLRNFNSNKQQLKLESTTHTNPVQKIVTPGDYNDPYWNIKNAKFRNTNVNKYKISEYDENQDEQYGVELPKPGLVGLYSDYEGGVTNWKLKKNKVFSYDGIDEESDENNDQGAFGYSTIDPRLGNRKSETGSKPVIRHPQRLMTPSINEDAMEDSNTQTVQFHSTPDFHVLEGFKLINLAKYKDKYLRKTTTDKFYSSEEESFIEHTSPNVDFDYDDSIDINQQVFKNCGKIKIRSMTDGSFGKSATNSQCDPWLAVVVLTKIPLDILCYATIVHPRAAVTAASCVHRKATGEVSVITGVWDINDRAKSQQRMVSIHTHPQFNSDELANDLAIIHWTRPLRLHANVIPACLVDPHVGDDCYFVGWGGYDQPLKQRPQWQQASILNPRTCNEKVSAPDVDLPPDAFCASVETRGTVTGVGGPLLCKGGDRISIVGMAVYREDVIVLLPTFDWVTSALRELQIS